MDMLSYFAKQQDLMAKLHNDFMDFVRGAGMTESHDDFDEFREKPLQDGEAPLDESYLELNGQNWESFEDEARENEAPSMDAFENEKIYYQPRDINPDDARFYGGFSMGLPSAVFVGNGFGRGPVGSLIPLAPGGLFHEVNTSGYRED